ncbi:MAG: AraC family transcriptional regulator [Treponema sp.]|nr:AraC family transcriptional regulator [Treponema sp.]
MSNEYQFIFINEGFGRLRSFEGEFALHSGCLVCMVPGEKYRYGPDPESPWTEYRIGFSGSITGEWAARGWLNNIITVHTIANHHDMLIPFEEAIAFSRNPGSALQPLAASCVMRIIGYLLENRNIQLRGTNIIRQAQEIFEKNIFYPIDMDELTGILHINYQQLRDRFREETGLSPYQYFLQLKINKAKELLAEGSLSIKEIAYKLSFDSPYYFSRLFKRKAGVSPSQWNNTTSERDLDLWPEK